MVNYVHLFSIVLPFCQCGVIQCVPNTKSRDQLGRQTEINLHEYFCTIYGDETTQAFQKVRSGYLKCNEK